MEGEEEEEGGVEERGRACISDYSRVNPNGGGVNSDGGGG